MTTYYKIIYDEQQVRRFHELVLPRLGPAEVHFLSMAARNKYLTPEERVSLDLGRTEMYAKTIVRQDTPDALLKHVRRLECDVHGYTTRNGQPIPAHAMVCYMNICQSDTIKAVYEFSKLTSEYAMEAMSLAVSGGDASNFLNRINKVDNNLLSIYQGARCKRTWVDIDLDMTEKRGDDPVDIARHVDDLDMGVDCAYVVDTKSGYHLLLRRDCIKADPRRCIEALEQEFAGRFKEIGVNKNDMVPLPGTLQAGHEVVFKALSEYL